MICLPFRDMIERFGCFEDDDGGDVMTELLLLEYEQFYVLSNALERLRSFQFVNNRKRWRLSCEIFQKGSRILRIVEMM
jgi:hypothetical protein